MDNLAYARFDAEHRHYVSVATCLLYLINNVSTSMSADVSTNVCTSNFPSCAWFSTEC